MSEEQNPFWLVGRTTLGGSDQEPLEAMMRKMCASVLRDMQPQVVEAELARAALQLRDRFAMAALTGFLANSSLDHLDLDEEEWAKDAYRLADAMLKARGDD